MTTGEIRKDNQGNLIVEETRVSLSEIISLAEQEFPGVSEELIYFPRPDYRNEENDFLIGELKPHALQAIDSGFQTTMYGKITLAQVRRQVARPNCDLAKVKLFWFKGDFCVAIKK